MRIAIAMRTFEQQTRSKQDKPECFAEFEVNEEERSKQDDSDEDVQVTVVLRGKRGELENPALGMTELVLRALKTRQERKADVIDVAGIAVEPAYATG